MIRTLRRGIEVLKTYSRLWILLCFIIVIPVLFLSFYLGESRAVEANISTVLLKKISTTHDALEAFVVTGGDIALLAQSLVERQSDITRLELVGEDEEGVLSTLYDVRDERTGMVIEDPSNFKSSLIEPGTTYVYQYVVDGNLRERAYRSITDTADTQLYIFTEHDFTPLYALLEARANKPLLLLALLFLFMLIISYWLARQINFESLFKATEATLNERDTFMTSLVHELRAPLTAMRGYASMIEESSSVPNTEREYAIKIRQSTARLVTLVNDFLEAARIQSGQLPLTWAKANANELLERVEQAALLGATEKGLVLALRLPNEVIELKTDAKRLEQVLTNMLSNAIKYTKKGSVTLSLKRDFRYVIFTIADTGAGISAEDQRKLFTPFVRVGDASQKEQVTGTGLGMWITRQLVTQLGGTIEIESIKDVGTHIIIKLPSALPEA